MSIKLKGSSDGSVSFDAPADTSPSGSDITLTLPTSAGSADQFLKNSGIAGELEYSSMVETSTGVGIGTSAPDDTLHLDGSTGHGLKLTDNNSHTTVFRTHSDGGIVKTASNHDLLFGTDDAERMRITNAGNIQVTGTRGGSLQPSDNDSLELFTSASNGNANTGCGLTFYNNDGNGAEIGGTIQVAKENGSINNTAGYMRFSTRPNAADLVERMRITSGGTVRCGDSVTSNAAGRFQVVEERTTGDDNDCNAYFETSRQDWNIKTYYNRAGTHYHLVFLEQGAERGSIRGSDGSNVTFNQGSDYRWKENIVEMTGAEGLEICKRLKPSKYNWIENREETGEINTVDGFIAHEVVEAGVLGAVIGEKDAVNEDGSIKGQLLDYGQMTPVLSAGIKGLIAKVETLETQNTAQQAQIDDLLARVTALEAA